MEREGPFWDAVEGRAPLPASAVTLGWELVSISPEEGTIEVTFTAGEAFLNPAGFIQGGFLAAMLDDTLGPALVAGLPPGDFAPTTDLHVQFLRPARPGRLLGRGRVVRRGRDVGFLAGELLDEAGATVAVATATVRIRPQMLQDRGSGSVALFRAIASVGQDPAQVDDHLIINVLAGGRYQEHEFGPYLGCDFAVMAHGDRADRLQQRHHSPPFDVVAGRMLEDLVHSIPMAAVKMFWSRRSHIRTLSRAEAAGAAGCGEARTGAVTRWTSTILMRSGVTFPS